jgi:hypothetical protein
MDFPQLEEELDLGLDPLDVVEHVLAAENLSFDRTDQGDLAFALAGDWKDYEIWIAWLRRPSPLEVLLSIASRADLSLLGQLQAGEKLRTIEQSPISYIL